MVKCAVYCRVSTDEQKNNTSLDGQEAACKRYADGCGFEVYQVYRDDYTGSRIDRPELQRMISDMRQGFFNAVIVNEVSRWGRDERVLLDLKYELVGNEMEFHLATFGRVDFSNPQHNFMYQSMGNFAVMWKDIIVLNFRNGKVLKAQDKKQPVMIGHPPYGYSREGKGKTAKLVIEPTEAQIVQDIFEWYTTGNGNGCPLSLRAIAMHLEEIGARTPHYRKNAAQYWIPATLRGILTNPIYIGMTHYGKTAIKNVRGNQDKKIRVKNPQSQWIQIPVPDLAIIDVDTFEAAQERRKKNIEQSRRNARRDYLMSGFFRCGACGSAMAGSFTNAHGSENLYYRCGNHWHRPEQAACINENRSIDAGKVEAVVWNWLVSLWSDEQSFQEGLTGLREKRAAELEPKQQRLERVNQIIQDQENKANNLINQIAGSSPALASMLKDRAEQELKLRDSYIDEAHRLELEIGGLDFTPEQEENLRAVIKRVRDGVAHPSFATKRAIFDLVGLKVIFHQDEQGRRLEVSCSLENNVIMLRPS